MVELLELVHVSCAFLSLGGFTLRGIWMIQGSAVINKPTTKIAPHILDTILLGSAVGILLAWQLNPFTVSWLTAKIVALLVYILFGMVAFRFGRSRRERSAAFILALFAGAYILMVAYTKTPYVFLSM